MRRISVESSNLGSVGYEQGTLEIQFNWGGVYQYYDVPEKVYEELMNADSHGVYFNANIKGEYDYERVR